MKVSIVIPIKDEAENIEALANELTKVMDSQTWLWKCFWVDDGSTDQTLTILQTICVEGSNHSYFSLGKTFGQSASLLAGFKEANGHIIATLDGDGQNDPADLPTLINIVLSGQADMAIGYRTIRQDNIIRKLSSRIGNLFRNMITGANITDVGCARPGSLCQTIPGSVDC